MLGTPHYEFCSQLPGREHWHPHCQLQCAAKHCPLPIDDLCTQQQPYTVPIRRTIAWVCKRVRGPPVRQTWPTITFAVNLSDQHMDDLSSIFTAASAVRLQINAEPSIISEPDTWASHLRLHRPPEEHARLRACDASAAPPDCSCRSAAAWWSAMGAAAKLRAQP